MKKPLHSHTNPFRLGGESPLSDLFASEQSDFHGRKFKIITGFKSKEVVAACKNTERHLGIRKEDLTIKKLYDLTYLQDRTQLLAEDRVIQKLIYQNAEIRQKLPYLSYYKSFRLQLVGGYYWEVQRLSWVYQFDPNGVPTLIWHRYQIHRIPSTGYIASNPTFFSKGVYRLFKEEALVKKMVAEHLFFNLSQQFTRTQLDICEYLIEDLTSKEIAAIMGISPKTVEKHRSNIIERGKALSSTLDTAFKVAVYLQKRGLI